MGLHQLRDVTVISISEFQACWSEVLKAELIGRPVGAKDWVRGLEQRLGHDFSPRKRGPKPKTVRTEAPETVASFHN
jgi:hypothetical protein